jgi:hypothetical protein
LNREKKRVRLGIIRSNCLCPTLIDEIRSVVKVGGIHWKRIGCPDPNGQSLRRVTNPFLMAFCKAEITNS